MAADPIADEALSEAAAQVKRQSGVMLAHMRWRNIVNAAVRNIVVEIKKLCVRQVARGRRTRARRKAAGQRHQRDLCILPRRSRC
jgi:hypothetical protein